MEYYQCREIVIESAHALPVQVDGEPLTKTPITIRTVPSALKVIVPRNAPENLFNGDRTSLGLQNLQHEVT
jgi:diacylglycerol kinase family enzyme